MASDIKSNIEMALFDTTSRAGATNKNSGGHRFTGISPPRGSLRAAPIACGCGWTGVPLLTDKIIAKQLAIAAVRTDGYRSHLFGRLFRRVTPAVGGLGASSVVAYPSRACQLMYSGRRI